MSELLNHSTVSEVEFTFKDDLVPELVIYKSGEPNYIQLSNGEHIQSACLNCTKKTCLSFDESHQSNIVDVVFSSDVCPTNALYLDEYEQIAVDEINCIGCGLCATRCPTGAIYLSNEKAIIHRDSKHLTIGKLPDKIDMNYTGYLVSNIEIITSKIINEINKRSKANFIVNNFIKSCFMVFGFKVIKPRIGDVNLRMDLILETEQDLLIVEVDNLGSPDTVRDIIDDVAIFCNKYDRKLEEISGLSCLLEFPNKRSEYYELITDTMNVLKLNIYSLSVGVLLSLLFNRKIINIKEYIINNNNTSCRDILEKNLGHDCGFSQKSNFIEAAK